MLGGVAMKIKNYSSEVERAIYKLVNIANNSDKTNTDYLIAEGLLSNIGRIPMLNIESLAKLCFMSSSSISKFFSKYDFESYSSFKKLLRNYLPNIETHIPQKNTEINYVEYVTNQTIDALTETKRTISTYEIEKAAEYIHHSDYCTIIANNELTPYIEDFQCHMSLAYKYVSYSPNWILSKDMPKRSVRIIPVVEHMYNHSKKLSAMMNIFTVERKPKDKEFLYDVHIKIIIQHQYVSDDVLRLANEGDISGNMLNNFLRVLYVIYSNTYVYGDDIAN